MSIRVKTTAIRRVMNWQRMDIFGATLLSWEEFNAAADVIPLHQNIWWWLRSPLSFTKAITACVGEDGYPTFNDSYAWGEIVPAIKTSNLLRIGLNPGDKIEFGGLQFTVINNDTALCDTSIGTMLFGETNNYEGSDARKYVDKWFATVIEKEKAA